MHPAVMIDSVVKNKDTYWSKLIEDLKLILADANKGYGTYMPLIKYLEKETLLAHSQREIKWVTKDLDSLKIVVEDA